MNRRKFLKVVSAGAAAAALRSSAGAALPSAQTPNIVYILADDLGYGDVKCLNANGKIATPNMDRFAAAGMTFTDAHGSSAVCTPSRYNILTGRYNWRSTLQHGVLSGYSKPLIKPDQLTVPSLLKQYGYHSACIGKWHLGMDMAPARHAADTTALEAKWPIDFTKPILNGPTTRGFDYYFGISSSADMPPFDFIENDHWTEIPTVEKKWVRQGPAAADYQAVNVLPTLTRKAVAYINERAKTGTPFFLYLPLNSPHAPIVPSPEFKGKSGINDYADFVMETDWAIGEVLQALEQNGFTQNTLVMVASDNGCSPVAGYPELLEHGHNPSYLFRGMKSDIWDGGHRIPFIVRWPGKVVAGSQSDQLVCLGDLLATCADMLGAKLPDNAGEDSVSILPALLGIAHGPLREAIVYHSIEGRFGIQQGNWKLELCPGSGGWSNGAWSNPSDIDAAAQGLPLLQLYDVSVDMGEKNNLQASHPDIIDRLTKLLEKYVADGRSTPGAPQKNDHPVDIFKKQLNKPLKTAATKNGEPEPD